MGISLRSAGNKLPVSRVVDALRRRAERRSDDVAAAASSAPPRGDYEYSTRDRSTLWVAARLLNRFAEAWYRQGLATYHVLRGRVVVFDRHLLFDTGLLATKRGGSLVERGYRAAMRLLPKPSLVVFIDAPGDVLYARKGDASPERLDEEARLYASQAGSVRRFERVDGTQSLEAVQREVLAIVTRWLDE